MGRRIRARLRASRNGGNQGIPRKNEAVAPLKPGLFAWVYFLGGKTILIGPGSLAEIVVGVSLPEPGSMLKTKRSSLA